MTDHLGLLTKQVSSGLRKLGFSSPNTSVLRALLDTAFVASIKTEENRFVKGSLTYSNPENPELDPPICRRADYPSFAAFGHRSPFEATSLVKLFRAVDMWSGSIAVFGTKPSGLFIWGVVDQQVQKNIRLHQEAMKGFQAPGIVTINIEGVGDISVYHGDLFLGRLRQDRLILREVDVLNSEFIADKIIPALMPFASSIANVLNDDAIHTLASLCDAWAATVARVCIGLRRLGTGGSLLISPKPNLEMLDVVHEFRYRRLGDSTILNVLDSEYLSKLQREENDSVEHSYEEGFAEADAEDRADELTGAVKIATNLAATDGLVLLDLTLGVSGFGVKIKANKKIGPVFDGPSFVRFGTNAREVDISHFGTRHGSMLRYCQADRKAIGIVVSQDGHTRLIASSGRHLVLWDNVKLLGYLHDVATHARYLRKRRQDRSKDEFKFAPRSLGFTDTPKTVDKLLASKSGNQSRSNTV